jgi:hypothetical protein
MNDPITVHSKLAQCQCKAGKENTDGQQVTGTSDLEGMIATLCSYDRFFGPCHIQTLSLTVRIAEALWRTGDPGTARGLLDRSIRDLFRSAGRTHAVRLTALNTSRDLELLEGDIRKALALQTEIAECWLLRAGCDAPETIAARSDLGKLMMEHPATPSETCARVV